MLAGPAAGPHRCYPGGGIGIHPVLTRQEMKNQLTVDGTQVGQPAPPSSVWQGMEDQLTPPGGRIRACHLLPCYVEVEEKKTQISAWSAETSGARLVVSLFHPCFGWSWASIDKKEEAFFGDFFYLC